MLFFFFFLYLCTTGKVSLRGEDEMTRFYLFLIPAPQKTEEKSFFSKERKYHNKFLPLHIAVTLISLSYWYHSQHLSDISCCSRQIFFLKIYLLILLKTTVYLLSMGQSFYWVSYTCLSTGYWYTSITRESLVPTGIRLPYIKRKNQLMNR